MTDTSMRLARDADRRIHEAGADDEPGVSELGTPLDLLLAELARVQVGRSEIAPHSKDRRFSDEAWAIYSYEGTREMNTLIVGRAITGESAFV